MKTSTTIDWCLYTGSVFYKSTGSWVAEQRPNLDYLDFKGALFLDISFLLKVEEFEHTESLITQSPSFLSWAFPTFPPKYFRSHSPAVCQCHLHSSFPQGHWMTYMPHSRKCKQTFHRCSSFDANKCNMRQSDRQKLIINEATDPRFVSQWTINSKSLSLCNHFRTRRWIIALQKCCPV